MANKNTDLMMTMAAGPPTQITSHLPVINGFSADITESEIEQLQKKGLMIFPDRRIGIPPMPEKVRASGTYPTKESNPSTPGPMKQMKDSGVEDVNTSGITGAGVTIGVADSGIDPNHPDLCDKIIKFKDFTDPTNSNATDPSGHGTAVAGVAAGTGSSTQKFHGVAPDANVISARVLGADGSGWEADIIEGLTWLANQGCEVLNVSLGGSETAYSPLSAAIDTIAQQDTIVCIAAGNDGPGKITEPGNASFGITVAACDNRGVHSRFSCLGPAIGNNAEPMPHKPDVMAWGENVVAAKSSEANMGFNISGHYSMVDGTSFSSPFVAGCAALFLQDKNNKPNTFLQAIKGTAHNSPKFNDKQEGAGRVDIKAAIDLS